MTEDQLPEQQANMAFWNQWCQSYVSGDVVLSEITPASLARYDRAYMRYYPYLLRRIRPEEMAGKRVLEIGVGFGALGQKIAEAGADYLGMDIAPNQVELMNYRMQMCGLNGRAIEGDLLKCDLPSESFDFVVSVGCFHHTGDIARCVDQTHRMLKPGGTARVMLYNRFSLRQWKTWPLKTLQTSFGRREVASQAQRLTYDACEGEAAPITAFTSIAEAKELFGAFSQTRIWKENCDPLSVRGLTLVSRKALLGVVGPVLGLDLYIGARK